MLKSKKFIMVTVLAMIMMFASVSSAFAYIDESEPNNTWETSTQTYFGEVAGGTISTSSDQDFFIFATDSSTDDINILFLNTTTSNPNHNIFVWDMSSPGRPLVVNGTNIIGGDYKYYKFSGQPLHVYVVCITASSASSSGYQFSLYHTAP